jgi:hypothetical protein
MRSPILLFVLSLCVSLSVSNISYGKEPKDCRSYVKSPDWIICLHSNDANIQNRGAPKTVPKPDIGDILSSSIESVLDSPEGPPDSAFFIEDKNGEIPTHPRVSNDFLNEIN